MRNYAQAKAKCSQAIIKSQSAILCVACSADWASFGVAITDAGVVSITMNDATCTAVKKECTDYIAQKRKLNDVKAYLLKLRIVDESSKFFADVTSVEDAQKKQAAWESYIAAKVQLWTTTEAAVMPWVAPDDCATDADCDAICRLGLGVSGINEGKLEALKDTVTARRILVATEGEVTFSDKGTDYAAVGAETGLSSDVKSSDQLSEIWIAANTTTDIKAQDNSTSTFASINSAAIIVVAIAFAAMF